MPRTRNHQRLSDLVHDSKLETYIRGDCTEHVFYEPGRSLRERHKRRVESWDREHTLGNGSFGVVYREKLRGGGQPIYRAVKKISKRVVEGEDLDYMRELEAIAKFSHQRYSHCFVRSEGWFELDDAVFITMEYLENGDLQKYLTRPFCEAEAASIVIQVLEGLQFMHSSGFVHRDLKPGNIMVVATGPNWYVKIADFGISKRRQHGVTTLHTMQRGTLGFAAPEVLGMDTDTDDPVSSYSFSVDLWSLGAVTFYLLTNLMAFATSAKTVMYALGASKFPIGPLESRQTSEEGKAFIKSLLSCKPEDRPTASTAASHKWLDSHVMTEDEVVSPRNSPPLSKEPSLEDNLNLVAANPIISSEGPVERNLLTTCSTTISSRASAVWPDLAQDTLRPTSMPGSGSPIRDQKFASSPPKIPKFDLTESLLRMNMNDSPVKRPGETSALHNDEAVKLPDPEARYDTFVHMNDSSLNGTRKASNPFEEPDDKHTNTGRETSRAFAINDGIVKVGFSGEGGTMVPAPRPSRPTRSSHPPSRNPGGNGKSMYAISVPRDDPTMHDKIVEVGSADEDDALFSPPRPSRSSRSSHPSSRNTSGNGKSMVAISVPRDDPTMHDKIVEVGSADEDDALFSPPRPARSSRSSHPSSRNTSGNGKSMFAISVPRHDPTMHDKIVEVGSADEDDAMFSPPRPSNPSPLHRHQPVHVATEYEGDNENFGRYPERQSRPTLPQQRSHRVGTDSRQDRRVRIVSPNRERSESKPLKGILKPPRDRFPENRNFVREGVAPRKDYELAKDIPPDARWTRISRSIVSPEALEIGKERFEVRDDCVIVLRVLSRDEIVAYQHASQALWERGK